MILELGLLLVAGLAGPPVPVQGEPDCGTNAPCVASPLGGTWTFAANGATWTVDVGAGGRIHATGERSVTIGRDVATYRSTLEGTLTETAVTLSITADNFSLPNFVPGPPTICAGTAIGMERYRGTCARDRDRMDFLFTRE